MRKFVVLFVAVLVTAIAGVASASWISEGTGEGAARAGTAGLLEATPGIPVGLLYPGGVGDVAVIVTNDNDFDVTVEGFESSGPVTSLDATCETDGHEVTFTDQAGTWLIPANTSLEVLLADAAAMGSGAANSCQGAEFRVPLTFS